MSRPELHRTQPNRAQINRANAQLSTGPRTAAGKERSSQNAFRHGLYSKQLVTPNEDPEELERLRVSLRSEHQPANTTEEILVDELAQHFWRLRRFRTFEADGWQPGSDWFTDRMLTLITRTLASAERSFYRALSALTKLQKARGFVPQQSPAPVETEAAAETEKEENGFVPSSTEDVCAHHVADDGPHCLYRPDLHFTPVNRPKKTSKKSPLSA